VILRDYKNNAVVHLIPPQLRYTGILQAILLICVAGYSFVTKDHAAMTTMELHFGDKMVQLAGTYWMIPILTFNKKVSSDCFE